MLGSTLVDFFIVRQLAKEPHNSKRKALLISSLVLNLGLLAYFKYANFFVENVNAFFQQMGWQTLHWTQVALPIGISFYTFQTITYAVDVYRGVHPPLKKIQDYFLYILSFPQMIAGPIVRFNTVADQIIARKESYEDKLQGLYRFSIGLAKKTLLANPLGAQADLILNNIENMDTPAAWVGILAYTFQIYFDFSGYSDMAIGLGKIMGFTFPENFNSPYLSKSISEFWRRWHITLGDFMRNYLYIPLGGNRVKTKSRLYFNLWFVFLLSGLWHGASWNFVIWGAYHGCFLILERLFLQNFLEKAGPLFANIFTFFLVVMGWVIFRVESSEELLLYFQKLYSFESTNTLSLSREFITVLALAIFFSVFTVWNKGKQLEHYLYFKKTHKNKQHLLLMASAMFLLLISVSSVASSDFNPFIYFKF
ncbi:MAG: MBOAT family O-acyltransferase [Lishizhenia sp.]|nr:MBOAT family O-acyltransferase [Lishizhenia sp.]